MALPAHKVARVDRVAMLIMKSPRIAVITQDNITGKETIYAKGLVVAPSLIDTHLHFLDGLSMKMAARDRVTTGMDLEIGAINVDGWYAAKKDQWPLNYGTTISQEGVRMLVHDPEAKIKSPQDATTILGSLQKVVAAEECLRNQGKSTIKREST